MTTSLLRVVATLFALTFIVAACASDSGAQWTFAPTVAQSDDAATAAPAAESITPEETSAAAPTEPAPAEPTTEAPADETVPEQPATASGEPRTVQLQADGALRFTDAEGQQVQDIPVTPGETIIFEVDNTAGFAHNFYIGEDAELMTPAGSTDTGIPDWSTGVQTLEWVVPEDISNLKFGCTVPGHYTLMQGTFSVSAAAPTEPAPAEPTTEAPADETVPEQPATASGEPRTVQLQADGALRFTDAEGQQVQDIPVTPGETIIFEVDNTAGFAHNFYIGEDAELMTPAGSTDTGIPDWSTGVQTLEWVVPEDISNLKFGCTVPGHYTLMQGTFSVSEAAPSEPAPAEPATEASTEAPVEGTEPVEGANVGTDARVITLEADAALRFLQDGEQIRDIPVTPGETIIFEVDNTAGFAHNIYIGEDAELSVPAGSTDVGIPDWDTGVQTLEWVVPEDISNLKFGCTVPGHYTLMQGTFSVST